jgi:hypothetical protein
MKNIHISVSMSYSPGCMVSHLHCSSSDSVDPGLIEDLVDSVKDTLDCWARIWRQKSQNMLNKLFKNIRCNRMMHKQLVYSKQKPTMNLQFWHKGIG